MENELQVTRSVRRDRFVYSVNGTELRTSKTKYALAVTGTGNPYHPSGYWLQLSNSYATINRTMAQFKDGVFVEIQEA